MSGFDCWCSYLKSNRLVRERVFKDAIFSPVPPRTLAITVRSGSGLSQLAIGEQVEDFRVDFPAVLRENPDQLVATDPWTAEQVKVKHKKFMLNGTCLVERSRSSLERRITRDPRMSRQRALHCAPSWGRAPCAS
jgi:hypothetical protein